MTYKKFDIIQIVIMIVLGIGILIGLFFMYQNMTSVRYANAIARAEKYESDGDYEKAISYYEKAIKINSSSLIAYQELANCYVSLDDTENVEEVLYVGWQNTGDETLLNNYVSLKLNDVIADMDNSTNSFSAIDEVLDILMVDNDNEEALQLLGTLRSYVLKSKNSDGANISFYTDDSSKSVYDDYADVIDKMLDIYNQNASDEMLELIEDYVNLGNSSMLVDTSDLSNYSELLTNVYNVTLDESTLSLSLALSDASDKYEVFADTFDELEDKNYESLQSLMTSKELFTLIDELESGVDEYIELQSQMTFSPEAICLTNEDDAWTYHFLAFDENEDTNGVITLEIDTSYANLIAEQKENMESAAVSDSSSDISNDTKETTDDSIIKGEIKEKANASSLEDASKALNAEDKDSSDESSTDKSGTGSSAEGTSDDEDDEIMENDRTIKLYYELPENYDNYYPHKTFYITCDYSKNLSTFTLELIVKYQDGSSDRSIVYNWGSDEEEE